MKSILKIISFIGLVLTLVPAFLVFKGSLSVDNCKVLMAVGTLLWFTTSPFWMNK